MKSLYLDSVKSLYLDSVGPGASSGGWQENWVQGPEACEAQECYSVFYSRDQVVLRVVRGPFLECLDVLWVVQVPLLEDLEAL